ncbi:MAG: succinate dehydrogenase cytochrome b subunit [Acidimicrobiales bacterium]|nr:succinate dehydrogenase cytochrome b subunit [Acidimicrobiales bacterium]
MATTTVARGSGDAGSARAKRKAPFPIELYRSALGKKYVMAITGILLMGFVFAHMVGNLKMYLGAEDFDHYAEFLRELLVPILPRTVALWLMRIGLIGAFALHIHAAYSLTRMNQGARTVKYQSQRDYIAANFASRSMRWTGIIVGLFLLFHLADLTWGFANPDFVRGAAYANVDASLSRIPVAILYIVANLALGVHLFHGGWSLFQSMGWNNPRFNAWRRNFAAGFAALIVIGNVSFPIAVLAGVVGN